jgi:hypothetical protein
MFDINFIAYAINNNSTNYEDFLIPFTFFALINNDNSYVEIIVLNKKKFILNYKSEIETLKKINNNFLIREPQYKLNNHINNTYRFFEKPTINSSYTYICDIDVMILDNILPKFKKNWTNNLCYNNIIRNYNCSKKDMRLTGCHLVETKKYYTTNFLKIQEKYYNLNKRINDEVILKNMCEKIHGLPDSNFKFRPIYGIHFSPNRGNNKKISLITYKSYKDKFNKLINNYPNISNFKIFKNLVNQLNNEFIIK